MHFSISFFFFCLFAALYDDVLHELTFFFFLSFFLSFFNLFMNAKHQLIFTQNYLTFLSFGSRPAALSKDLHTFRSSGKQQSRIVLSFHFLSCLSSQSPLDIADAIYDLTFFPSRWNFILSIFWLCPIFPYSFRWSF